MPGQVPHRAQAVHSISDLSCCFWLVWWSASSGWTDGFRSALLAQLLWGCAMLVQSVWHAGLLVCPPLWSHLPLLLPYSMMLHQLLLASWMTQAGFSGHALQPAPSFLALPWTGLPAPWEPIPPALGAPCESVVQSTAALLLLSVAARMPLVGWELMHQGNSAKEADKTGLYWCGWRYSHWGTGGLWNSRKQVMETTRQFYTTQQVSLDFIILQCIRIQKYWISNAHCKSHRLHYIKMLIPVKLIKLTKTERKREGMWLFLQIINQTTALLFSPAKSYSMDRWHCHQLVLIKGQPPAPWTNLEPSVWN